MRYDFPDLLAPISPDRIPKLVKLLTTLPINIISDVSL